jgi:hypothetical protein
VKLLSYDGRPVGVGDVVSVDCGDSVIDGGVFRDRITGIGDLGVSFAHGEFVPARQFETLHIELVQAAP